MKFFNSYGIVMKHQFLSTLDIPLWKHTKIYCFLVLFIFGCNPSALGEDKPNAIRQPIVATFHVHSTVSTGKLDLDQLAIMAKDRSLDAIVLSENFVLRYEYGLPPFRGAFRVMTRFPSVLEYGLKPFLDEVEKVQARMPEIVLVPGVEVAPYYHWTGSLLNGALTMYNAQKNLLVMGLECVDDYLALPVIGNTDSYHYNLQTVINILPALLFIPAVWPPYNSQLGNLPYQTFIDTVRERNGVVIWSLPEAPDFSVHSFEPISQATIKIDPYSDLLLQTNHYTGFGGVYQDTRTVTDPGGVWDHALQQYLTGHRQQPPFVFGEIAFHEESSVGIELDQVLIVFWVRERTAAGILEAMRTGHHYAVGRYGNQHGLRLHSFYAKCGDGKYSAVSGETLIDKKACAPTVRISGFTTDHNAHSVSIRIIRSGQVVATYDKNTPFEMQFTDTQAPWNESMYYRIDIHGHGELISNPIFLNRLPTS